MWAILRSRGRFGLLAFVDCANDQKDYERDDQETDHVVDEGAVGNDGHTRLPGVNERRQVCARQIVEEVGEINLAKQQSDRRHDYSVNQRSDNLAARQ